VKRVYINGHIHEDQLKISALIHRALSGARNAMISALHFL
jgi:hypothetical protein